VSSDVKGAYRYNNSFIVASGEGMYVEGSVNFPPETRADQSPLTKRDGFYHTAFGPCVANNGEVYAANNHNMKQAFKARLAKCRQPEILGYEEWMRQNQRDYISTNSAFVQHLRDLYAFSCDTYTSMVQEAMEHHADPHPKREERIAAFLDSMDQNVFDRDCWFLDKKGTIYQFKKGETAKPKKAGRLVGNLGCPASLQGFRLTSYLKYAMAEIEVRLNGGTARFVPKPGAAALESCMAQLIEPDGRFFFAYHSDDACLTIRTKSGKLIRVNLDISSCDASHTDAIFEMLIEITPDRCKDDMRRLVKQCELGLEIRDLVDKKNRIHLTPRSARLYSGSTLTTLINNIASLSICHSIVNSEIECVEDIVAAAARAGYIVTCEDCSDIHKIQFLKHSPVYDTTGRLRAMMNPGVLFRLMGTCKGDLPGSRHESLRLRGERFQAGLLQGAYPRVSAPFIDRLKQNVAHAVPCKRSNEIVAKEMLYRTDAHAEAYSVTSSEMWERYSLTPLQICELEEGLGSCKYGDHYRSSATEEVLLLDYGLGNRKMPETDHHTPEW
jgi:hypothetical protein